MTLFDLLEKLDKDNHERHKREMEEKMTPGGRDPQPVEGDHEPGGGFDISLEELNEYDRLPTESEDDLEDLL